MDDEFSPEWGEWNTLSRAIAIILIEEQRIPGPDLIQEWREAKAAFARTVAWME